MPLDLDDDDTIPTGNAGVLRDLTARLASLPLGVVGWGAATTPGVRRRVNEDAWGRREDLFVVADGMGGRGGGALAARVAVDRFLERSARATETPHWRRIVAEVNADVRRAGGERGVDRLGTTLLAASVGGAVVTLVHLGDSRAYRATHHPGDRLDLLTGDHTVRAELLAAGLDVGDYRERGVALHGLTSFIGLEDDVLRVDVLAVSMRPGDRLLLCTDGVYRQLDDDALRATLSAPSPRLAAEGLVEAADRAGGRDNATAIVLQLGPVGAHATPDTGEDER
jgi:serine/threonine protein phosphatase PrpC